MPLSAGTRLGPYEILAPIGAGGMGQVYRARDTRLNRAVAIKVAHEKFSERFSREAHAIAALNHPNICQLYDVGPNYLVMEFIEGQCLKGPLPLEEAMRLASQIAEALGAAHEKGIVHRDLKPANIMITPAGVVKVLDFGLAKAAEPEPTANPETSPTLTMRATQMGMILGTAAYMSPEQARGKTVDKRADIWAFGAVLYEMLTGQPPFTGDDITEILASVVKTEPDFSQVPAQIRPLLQRCLEKDPKKRLRDIGDLDLLLNVGQAHGLSSTGHGPVPQRWPWIAWALAGLLALALGLITYRHVTEETRVLKVSVLPPDKMAFKATSLPAVSPDGRRLAFVATLDGKDQLWVRDLDSLAARALAGTDGADEPFWSPDSRTIAFFAGGKLKKIEMAGGPALTLCDAGAGRGGTWNESGVILFGVNGGSLFRVPAAGGSATALTTPNTASGEDHRFPWLLPDGHHFLYTATNRDVEKIAIYAGDVESKGDSKNRKLVVTANSNAVYTPPGYLLFVRDRTLMAQPFDAGKLQTTGEAVPVAEQVDSVSGRNAQNQFSASRNGVLAYTAGGGGGNLQLTWFDRSGRVTGTLGEPGFLNWGAISPDGNVVAVDRLEPQTRFPDIWLHDLARGTTSRFTFGPRINDFPVWSPDGSHIAFRSSRDGLPHPFQKGTSGTAQDEVLSKPLGQPPATTLVEDWSRDGRYIIMGLINSKTKDDVWVMPTFGDRKPFPYLQTEFNEGFARLSPNGQWLAYTSDESKRAEVYVQSFPTPGGKWQVSTTGGSRSVWSRDGKELYFIAPDGKMMVAEVASGAKFQAGVPKVLFDARFPGGQSWFDVSKDGRFLIPIQFEQAANAPMTVVVNWTAGLKK